MEHKANEIVEYVIVYHDKRELYESVLVIVSDKGDGLSPDRSCIRFPKDVVVGLHGYGDDGWWEVEDVWRLDSIPRMSYVTKS